MILMRLRVIILIFFAFTLSVNLLTAQKKNRKITISGHVTDASNNPVAGALILVNNKSTSVYTSSTGFYKIRISPDASLIGVLLEDNQVRSEFIDNRTEIDFSLKELVVSNQNGQNIVKYDDLVDIGISKVAVSKVNVLDASGDKSTPYSDIYEMIRSKVPGVDVIGKNIRIRGISTLEGENNPLFVIDGIPVNSIDYIMPATVESITALKGASAAIYGARGVNGVIVIDLKKTTTK
jgi:TonB-dependent SusC/RagA subfamily outer membrane receptor